MCTGREIVRAAELLERLRGRPFYMLASLALATGMRRNDMLALRWQDIDLDAGRLTVEQALEQTAAHGIRVKAPKTRLDPVATFRFPDPAPWVAWQALPDCRG
jgi:integrase